MAWILGSNSNFVGVLTLTDTVQPASWPCAFHPNPQTHPSSSRASEWLYLTLIFSMGGRLGIWTGPRDLSRKSPWPNCPYAIHPQLQTMPLTSRNKEKDCPTSNCCISNGNFVVKLVPSCPGGVGPICPRAFQPQQKRKPAESCSIK